jgi:hypothetical protein
MLVRALVLATALLAPAAVNARPARRHDHQFN